MQLLRESQEVTTCGGCNNVTEHDGGERVAVCGQPYESMLCGNVATVGKGVAHRCPRGGVWTVPDPYQGGTLR